MRLIIKKHDLSINPHFLMRQAGYIYIENKHTGQGSFVRALARLGYPRFHIYLKEEKDNLIFNVHFDQKRPSYSGVSAHSGEYDSEVVKQEIERLKTLL